MKKPLWIPSEEKIKNSNLQKFINFVNEQYHKSFDNYDATYDWSVNNIEEFWKSIWDYSEIIHSNKYSSILDKVKMPGAKWFGGAKLNFAENLLRYKDDQTAIISERENFPLVRLTYSELYSLTAKCASGLKELGVKKGDVVAGFVTNISEPIISMLAATSLGALWTSCSPDFGIQGVIDRFGQTKPKVLFAIEGYSYAGKEIDCRKKISEIVKRIPSIKQIVLIEKFNDFKKDSTRLPDSEKKLDNFIYFNGLIDNTSKELSFEQSNFDHPVYIMYSSGTTGIPKCIVHGAGGTLLQHFKEHVLHTDLKREDTITYFTTCGWMMWNWLVSSLQVGATLFLYDGNPGYPDINILWKYIEQEKISVFGTSPKYLTLCQKSEITPKDEFDLSSLKSILSTGSPLTEENFNWVYQNVKSYLQLSSISGGTDIISCFMLGCPIKPVYPGEIQCRGLGMKVEAFNEKGEPLIENKGELVCTKPFPSMPVFFWDDPDGKKYHEAYFDHFPGVWRHGDYIKITETGGVVVYGRSDSTLNPGGVRIGTAEIYRIVEAIDEVVDTLVVGPKWNDDIKIVLFVVLKDNLKLDSELTEKIKLNIRAAATPRHVPTKIIQIKEVPRTISGKKVEIAVTKILNGEEVENRDALANPDSLKQFNAVRIK